MKYDPPPDTDTFHTVSLPTILQTYHHEPNLPLIISRKGVDVSLLLLDNFEMKIQCLYIIGSNSNTSLNIGHLRKLIQDILCYLNPSKVANIVNYCRNLTGCILTCHKD